ncbi:MAG: hypothetical protein LBC63_01750 [Holophagales bacterium]|jgi:hypothetical protein|nr:hypothetical protein [Holophagales bacterium]
MSAAIVQLIEEMEKHLSESEMPDENYLAEWNDKFRIAVESAEAAGTEARPADWESIVNRANGLAETIQKMVAGLCFERDQIREELALQSSGRRALKGYAPGAN